MTILRLQRNVQFLYEEQIARCELAAFGCDAISRSDDDWRLFSAHVNGNAKLIEQRSAYTGAVDGAHTVYAKLIQPNYQGGRFNRTRSVNQYLTHWIYPYRGKFHPQMIRGLLNILDVRPGSRVLEPYLGSGTTAVEASLLGADVVGMSVVPEVLAARHGGLRVLAVAVVSDACIPEQLKPASVEELLRVAAAAEPSLTALLQGIIARL